MLLLIRATSTGFLTPPRYGAKRDEDVQREAYDALRVELLDRTCLKSTAKQSETQRNSGVSLVIAEVINRWYS